MLEAINKPVLRVYEGYGEADIFKIFFGNLENETRQLDIFKSHGFEIVVGGTFNPTNPYELAISADDGRNLQDLYRDAANVAGLEMPGTYNPRDVLTVSQAIVAKLPSANRGEFKYLLETQEQKAKFITWALLYQKVGNLIELPNPADKVARLVKKVGSGRFTDPLIRGQGWLPKWVFEEFVETPGDYYTSYRVVADALGNVHYGQVAKSENRKDDLGRPSITSHLDKDPLKEVSRPGRQLTLVLEHPLSPFYLAPRRFISNIAGGGTRLVLSGEMAAGPVVRKLLGDLDIDPDKPEIPNQLVRASSLIGKHWRGEAPYVGIDYLKRKDSGHFVLLEVNKGPILNPLALGLPDGTDQAICQSEMARRIASSVVKQK